jgi:hypothetical protein
MTGKQGSDRRRKVFQIMALMLLLVAFPAISWYYLQIGLDYRLETLKDLGDHGKIPDFELVTYKLDTLDREYIDHSMVVASFFDLENETLSTAFGENLRKLHEQFDSRDDLFFLHHVLGDMQEAKKINAFENKYELTDETQCFFLVEGRPSIEQLAREGYQLPLGEGMTLADNPYLVLADTTGTIRRYYDVRKNEEVKRLVEHIAILLPHQKEKDLVFKREREK